MECGERCAGKRFGRSREEGEERIEGIRGEAGTSGFITKGGLKLITMTGRPRLPKVETFLLGLRRRGQTTVKFLLALGVSRHQLLKQSHV